MIRNSPLGKVLALTTSATLLISGVHLAQPEQKIEVAGGGMPVEARMGTTFEDMVAGTLTPENVENAPQTPEPPVETTQQPDVLETQKPIVEATPESLPKQTPRASVKDPAPTPQPTGVAMLEPQLAASLSPAASLEAVLPRIIVQTPTPLTQAAQVIQPQIAQPLAAARTPLTPVAPQTVELSEALADPTQTITAQTPDSTAPQLSTRPQRRDPEKAAKIAAARPQPTKPKVTRKQQAKAETQRGNAKRNNTQGAENGTNQQAKAKSKGHTNQAAAQAGNAAKSNYSGQVMRKIRRVRKPNVRARGTAVIAFSVAASGGLAAVSVARSSGSAALDQAALRVVQKAAPFPKPPAGARRAFSVQIKGS